MSLLTRKELLERLNSNSVDVYFTKVNGTTRKMRATLNRTIIENSGYSISSQGTQRDGPEHSGVLTVFDLDINEWRAFRIEHVHATITPTLGEIKSDGQVRID